MSSDLHAQIDQLHNSRDTRELIMKLQKLLHQIAYYVDNSEGRINERREEWHDEFHGALGGTKRTMHASEGNLNTRLRSIYDGQHESFGMGA
jgi:hypothetical protein